jgi:hypothetical protein
LKVALKIGGCEAIRDLIEARQYGVDYVIAPMVETPYALTKFIAAKDKIFPRMSRRICPSCSMWKRPRPSKLEKLGEVAQGGNVGFVFGRVDFAGSLGHDRSL